MPDAKPVHAIGMVIEHRKMVRIGNLFYNRKPQPRCAVFFTRSTSEALKDQIWMQGGSLAAVGNAVLAFRNIDAYRSVMIIVFDGIAQQVAHQRISQEGMQTACKTSRNLHIYLQLLVPDYFFK